jgi:hypothetical protein
MTVFLFATADSPFLICCGLGCPGYRSLQSFGFDAQPFNPAQFLYSGQPVARFTALNGGAGRTSLPEKLSHRSNIKI